MNIKELFVMRRYACWDEGGILNEYVGKYDWKDMKYKASEGNEEISMKTVLKASWNLSAFIKYKTFLKSLLTRIHELIFHEYLK